MTIAPSATPTPYRSALEALGFLVTESDDWPHDDRTALDHQVVVLRLRQIHGADMLAARLRAKPRFGHRVLIVLVAGSMTTQERVAACVSGFDDVLMDTCGGRQLAASVLKRLRLRPELRVLPSTRQAEVGCLDIADCRLQIDDWD